MGSNILDISHSNILSDISPQIRKKRKSKQMGLHQTKQFLHRKGNRQQKRKTTLEWENIFADTSHKGLIPEVYKELTKLNTKKQTKKQAIH